MFIENTTMNKFDKIIIAVENMPLTYLSVDEVKIHVQYIPTAKMSGISFCE